MPLAEGYNGPLETHTEKAEMAATDPEYGVDMTVDGINYRRGENKPELPELYFERDDDHCFRGDHPLTRLGLPALAATDLLS